jgi:Fe2+ transport system protein FeoA
MTIDDLEPNQQCRIISVDHERMQSLGIVPNRLLTVLRKNRGCLHIRVGSTEYAIRRDLIKLIKIIKE